MSQIREEATLVAQLIRSVGGVEAAERACGKSKSLFSAYQSPNDARSIPLRDIETLENLSRGEIGHPHVAHHLARLAGYELVKLPETSASGSDILALLSAAARAKGEADNSVLTALASGQVTKGKAIALIPMLRTNVEIAMQMIAELEAIAGEDAA